MHEFLKLVKTITYIHGGVAMGDPDLFSYVNYANLIDPRFTGNYFSVIKQVLNFNVSAA